MPKLLKNMLVFLSITLLFILLLSLGKWQWHRYLYKKDIENTYSVRQHAPALPLIAIDQDKNADLMYQRVYFSGRIDNHRTFFLDNQVMDKKVGFKVYSVANLTKDQAILIDRGWIQRDLARKTLPEIPSVEHNVSLQGVLWKPEGQPFLLKTDPWSTSWPKLIQSLDMAKISSIIDQSVSPWILILDADQSGCLRRQAPITTMKSEQHLGYAVQWWLMALALLILCLLFKWRKRHG